MRSVLWILVLGCAALVAFSFGMSLAPAPSTLAGPQADATRADGAPVRPVLVELFTSQGCSSCPPADALLQILADDPNRRIIPLSFHVDYWNRLGWRDPFSSAEWSERQRLYNEAMQTGRVYTPQLVIDGRRHCVGSDVKVVYRHLDDAAVRPVGVDIELGAQPGDGALRVTYRAELRRRDDVSVHSVASTDLLLALAETGLETPVKSGENARRVLKNDFVVRRLLRLDTLGMNKTTLSGSLDLPLQDVENAQNVKLVAFAQNRGEGGVLGAVQGVAMWPNASGPIGSIE